MKLKYYLRGLGLGILLTAILMGVVLGKNTSRMSDEEIIKRAKQLGMVEAESTLSSYSETAKSSEVTDEANNTASDTEVDSKGEEVPEEIHETESSASESISEVDEAQKESEALGENSESIESEEDVKLASEDASVAASTDTVEAENAEAENGKSVTETPATDDQAKNEEPANPQTENQAVTETEPEPETPQESTPAEQTNSGDTNYIVVVLPSGSDSDDCARILREAGVISDGVEFNNYLIKTGKDRLIRSGTKQIPKGATFEEITSIITR